MSQHFGGQWFAGYWFSGEWLAGTGEHDPNAMRADLLGTASVTASITAVEDDRGGSGGKQWRGIPRLQLLPGEQINYRKLHEDDLATLLTIVQFVVLEDEQWEFLPTA